MPFFDVVIPNRLPVHDDRPLHAHERILAIDRHEASRRRRGVVAIHVNASTSWSGLVHAPTVRAIIRGAANTGEVTTHAIRTPTAASCHDGRRQRGRRRRGRTASLRRSSPT